MAAQTSYSYQTPRGVAGGLYDISPYAIDSRTNGEIVPGALMFGMGAVQGDVPGVTVAIPTAGDTGDAFEGIVLTGFTNQQNMLGEIQIYPQQTVGILRWGRAWARIAEGVTPAYGESLFLIIDGDEAGLFTTSPGIVDAENLAINGRFIGGAGTGAVAPVELYNQKAE